MALHVVTTTKKGILLIQLGTFGLCRRHVAILTIASNKPSPAINVLCKELRRQRDVALTNESITEDLVELQYKGLVRVHQ